MYSCCVLRTTAKGQAKGKPRGSMGLTEGGTRHRGEPPARRSRPRNACAALQLHCAVRYKNTFHFLSSGNLCAPTCFHFAFQITEVEHYLISRKILRRLRRESSNDHTASGTQLHFLCFPALRHQIQSSLWFSLRQDLNPGLPVHSTGEQCLCVRNFMNSTSGSWLWLFSFQFLLSGIQFTARYSDWITWHFEAKDIHQKEQNSIEDIDHYLSRLTREVGQTR